MTPLDQLRAIVVKERVSLGCLSHEERQLALLVAAGVIPAGEVVSEAQANARLKSALSSACAFLGTDHVELRRWLVDTGWWQRDAYGRGYSRVPPHALRDELQDVAEAAVGIDLVEWVRALREAEQARRDRRRAAWVQGVGES